MLYEDLTFEEIIDIRVQEELDIAREETRKKAREEAWEAAWKKAWEEAWVEAWEESKEKSKQTIARNLLAEGMTLEFVEKITGLPLEEIKKLSSS